MNNIREIAAEAVATWGVEARKWHSVFLCFHLPKVHRNIRPHFWNVVKMYQWFKQRNQLRLWLRELRRQLGPWRTMESYIYSFLYIQGARKQFAYRESLTEVANKVRLRLLSDAMEGKPTQLEKTLLEFLSEYKK